jgi:hypothetical protein
METVLAGMVKINRFPATFIEYGGSHAWFHGFIPGAFFFFKDICSGHDLVGYCCAIYVLCKVIDLQTSDN